MSVQEELRKDIEARINTCNQELKGIDVDFELLVKKQERIHTDIAELRGVLHSIVTAKPINNYKETKKRGQLIIPSDDVIRDWIIKKKEFTQREFCDLLGCSYTSYEVINKHLKRFEHMIVQVQIGGAGGKPNIYAYRKP